MIEHIQSLFGRDSEHGAALVWVAGSMVALLAMTALAVDLGWYYLNAARLQRAADAAALAGVVHLPASTANAATDAENAARANDFGGATLTPQVLSDNRYQVTLAADVPTFFAPVVGIESLPLSRTATAEYVKPVPMGSPFNSFGYGYDASQSFWAAINAPYTAKDTATRTWRAASGPPAGPATRRATRPIARPATTTPSRYQQVPPT